MHVRDEASLAMNGWHVVILCVVAFLAGVGLSVIFEALRPRTKRDLDEAMRPRARRDIDLVLSAIMLEKGNAFDCPLCGHRLGQHDGNRKCHACHASPPVSREAYDSWRPC